MAFVLGWFLSEIGLRAGFLMDPQGTLVKRDPLGGYPFPSLLVVGATQKCLFLVYSLRFITFWLRKLPKIVTTSDNGSLGSRNDEERSEMR